MTTSEKTIHEHDIVMLEGDYHALKSGAIGAVVHVYPSNISFEVEFINTNGNHVIETVYLNQINKL